MSHSREDTKGGVKDVFKNDAIDVDLGRRCAF
jgi:hypothetical protein